MEFSILKNFHGELTYGLDPNIKFTSHLASESSHHEYKMALKYFFVDHYTNFPIPYIGLEHFAIRNKYELTDDTFRENNIAYSFDFADVYRNVDGLRVHLGFKIEASNNFWFDCYA